MQNINELMRPRKVCLCKSVDKAELLKAVENGARTLGQVVEKTGATTGCGTCIDEVKEIVCPAIERKKAEKQNQNSLPF